MMTPEPMLARDAINELFAPGGPMGPGSLRVANHGQNPPITAQAAHLLIHALPQSVARYPGSREFRTAARAFLAARGIPLEPTRSDIRGGIGWLARNGQLPAWVLPGDRFGGV